MLAVLAAVCAALPHVHIWHRVADSLSLQIRTTVDTLTNSVSAQSLVPVFPATKLYSIAIVRDNEHLTATLPVAFLQQAAYNDVITVLLDTGGTPLSLQYRVSAASTENTSWPYFRTRIDFEHPATGAE